MDKWEKIVERRNIDKQEEKRKREEE